MLDLEVPTIAFDDDDVAAGREALTGRQLHARRREEARRIGDDEMARRIERHVVAALGARRHFAPHFASRHAERRREIIDRADESPLEGAAGDECALEREPWREAHAVL